MCVVTSCISDKSRQGLMPEAHLADGRLVLVMVQKCSRLQYLRFLVQLATKGIVPGSLPFVRTEFATEVQVEAEGRPGSWNVDGELLRHGRVNVGIHAGLVDVFARGVELM
jgi:ceramide kinase